MIIHDLHERPLHVLGIDFESYYDKDFTLSKMTTATYVRDPRFKVHGASIIHEDTNGQLQKYWITAQDLPDYFFQIDWENIAMLAHNCAFDSFILTQHFGFSPAYYLDTQSMSQGEFGPGVGHSLNMLSERLGLGQKIADILDSTRGVRDLSPEHEARLAEYALQDAQLMWDAFRILYMDRGYPEKEMHIIDLTIRAFAEPKLEVDFAVCRAEMDAEAQKKSQLVAKAGVPISQLASNKQFAELLRSRGVEPPLKISKTTGRETYAFAMGDQAFLDLASIPEITDIVQARKAVKSTINESRAFRLMQNGQPTLPIPLRYCGAITHRWSGHDSYNVQNLSSGRKEGQSDALRRAIRAPKGWKFCKIDSSQVECRVNAWLSGEESLLSKFRNGDDPYIELASLVYGYPVNKKEHPLQRAVGKMGELSLQFGVGAMRFTEAVQIGAGGPAQPDFTMEQGTKAVQTYRAIRPSVVQSWARLDEIMRAMPSMSDSDYVYFGPGDLCRIEKDRVMMPNGLYMNYYGFQGVDDGSGRISFIYYAGKEPKHLYGAKLYQNIVQSVARSIVAEQMLLIAKEIPDIVLLVHDECDFIVPEPLVEEAIDYALKCFRTPPEWCADIPLDAEAKYGDSYAFGAD